MATLNQQQLDALKADIDANHAGVPNTPDGHFAIAAAYGQPADTDFRVWRRSVSDAEIMQNNFDWTRVDNLSIGKARIWDWMFRSGSFNPSNPAIREGINEVWKGSQADRAVRATVYSHCHQAATRGQMLFAVGEGNEPDEDGVGPATDTLDGPITPANVEQARRQ